MDRQAALAAFDEQIRRHPEPEAPDGFVEHDEGVVRCISGGDGWTGVTWSDLDPAGADRVIAAQITRFAKLSHPWEWKHYSHDQPRDLPARLLAAGFRRQPAEALLVAEIAELTLDVPPPPGVELRAAVDERGVEALVSVHDEVFGEDHSALGKALLAGLARRPPTAAAVVAWAEQTPVAAGRVEFHLGTDFASLWGGGTVPAWRRRGVFRALVARRASLASATGFRYLQVDASPGEPTNSRATRLHRTRHHHPVHAPRGRRLTCHQSALKLAFAVRRKAARTCRGEEAARPGDEQRKGLNRQQG